ncbi:FAD-binding monooxygenase [Sulfurospirillum sp. 1612]|uniref:FAD-binding monooxygenase n=1 Tax=Sulfurospirillum sp. 1612 TaxID=3094835 RepID=UPI002F95E759
MQFHLNGFHAGSPEIFTPAKGREGIQGAVPEKLDVLIIGSGPAGLTLAAQLAAYPQIQTRIVEQKEGPMVLGQADGVSCRSMEMFKAFGFAEDVLKEGYWVNETNFWKPDTKNSSHIVRDARVQDVKDGLSEMPHIILNQARVHDKYLEVMRHSPSRLEVDYQHRLMDLKIEPDEAYPVAVRLACGDEVKTVRARYVVGCDGARSLVRNAIGRELKGDYANQAWGVMDVLPVTNFPDIRFKCIIKSASHGNILLIPREGGHMVRMYVELDKINTRGESKKVTLEKLIATAQNIFHPYTFEAKEVSWWSVYEVGHSVTDKFDDVPHDEQNRRLPHVFIAGDACHTHSAKAGQGMNVSMGDTFNLGWKLASVLMGQSDASLLHTYSAERQAVAQGLIDYDHKWSRVMGASIKEEAMSVKDHFIQGGVFTAGLSVQYTPSILTAEATWQSLARGFEIGKRFHSAPVIRLADGKRIHLGDTIKADTRWRLYAFSGHENPANSNSAITKLCEFLEKSPKSPIVKYTQKNEDIDAVISLYGVFQQHHHDIDFEAMPPLLKPSIGRYGLKDYEKMYAPDFKNGDDIFEMRGIDRKRGCLVIVRPDQYVAHVVPLNAYEELERFFSKILIKK